LLQALAAHLGQRAIDRVAAAIPIPEGDVLPHGSREEEDVLEHEPDLPPKRLPFDLADVDPVDPDGPLLELVEPGEQIRDRGLPRARGPDDRDLLSRRDPEGDVP